MQRKVLHILAIVLAAVPLLGSAQGPKDGMYFTAEDIQAVLKHAADTKRTIPDNTIQVLDMGKYQSRRRRGAPRGARGPRRGRGRRDDRGAEQSSAGVWRAEVPARQAPAASTMTTRPRATS